MHFALEVGSDALEEFGGGGGKEVWKGGEAHVVGLELFVEDQAFGFEEGCGFFEGVEHICFYVVLFEEFSQGIALRQLGVFGQVAFEIDISGDPIAAALCQRVANLTAELPFLFHTEIHEQAFVDDGDGAGGKFIYYFVECWCVECVQWT